MFYRMLKSYVTIGRTFGHWGAPLPMGALLAARIGATIVAQRVDLLLPRLRQCRLVRPIVLVGSPRSGSTFLHRFLDGQHVGSGLRIWDCICPSVTLQTLLGPLLPHLERAGPARNYTSNEHTAGLLQVDTDDIAIMARFLDGALLEAWVNCFEPSPAGDVPLPDTNRRDFQWLARIWHRTLINRRSTRIVAKLHSLGYRLPAFQAAFPDAKVLYLVRDPLEAIPSTMSLVTGMLERRLGFWRLPEEVRRRYLARLYQLLVRGYRRFVSDWTSGAIDRDGVMIVRYDRMMNDFAGLMDELLTFVGHEPDQQLTETIAAAAGEQRRYRSRHAYDLERFGLDPAMIRSDCADVYETLLTDLPAAAVQ